MTQKLVKLKKQLLIIINDKYITTPEFTKLTGENYAARLAQANLVAKLDFDTRLIKF